MSERSQQNAWIKAWAGVCLLFAGASFQTVDAASVGGFGASAPSPSEASTRCHWQLPTQLNSERKAVCEFSGSSDPKNASQLVIVGVGGARYDIVLENLSARLKPLLKEPVLELRYGQWRREVRFEPAQGAPGGQLQLKSLANYELTHYELGAMFSAGFSMVLPETGAVLVTSSGAPGAIANVILAGTRLEYLPSERDRAVAKPTQGPFSIVWNKRMGIGQYATARPAIDPTVLGWLDGDPTSNFTSTQAEVTMSGYPTWEDAFKACLVLAPHLAIGFDPLCARVLRKDGERFRPDFDEAYRTPELSDFEKWQLFSSLAMSEIPHSYSDRSALEEFSGDVPCKWEALEVDLKGNAFELLSCIGHNITKDILASVPRAISLKPISSTNSVMAVNLLRTGPDDRYRAYTLAVGDEEYPLLVPLEAGDRGPSNTVLPAEAVPGDLMMTMLREGFTLYSAGMSGTIYNYHFPALDREVQSIATLMSDFRDPGKRINRLKEAFQRHPDNLYSVGQHHLSKITITSTDGAMVNYKENIVVVGPALRPYKIGEGFEIGSGTINLDTGEMEILKRNAGSPASGCVEHLKRPYKIMDVNSNDKWRHMEQGNQCLVYYLFDDNCARDRCGRWATPDKPTENYFMIGYDQAWEQFNKP